MATRGTQAGGSGARSNVKGVSNFCCGIKRSLLMAGAICKRDVCPRRGPRATDLGIDPVIDRPCDGGGFTLAFVGCFLSRNFLFLRYRYRHLRAEFRRTVSFYYFHHVCRSAFHLVENALIVGAWAKPSGVSRPGEPPGLRRGPCRRRHA
jgi:hypothetical protein